MIVSHCWAKIRYEYLVLCSRKLQGTDLRQLILLHRLHHVPSIGNTTVQVWQEQLDSSKLRSYVEAVQPVSPPCSEHLSRIASRKHGISRLLFNPDGSMLATKSESMPSTIWIWSMQTGSLSTVLIHHSPIKKFEWHTGHSDLLLMQCSISDPSVHIWKSTWQAPIILTVPFLSTVSGKLEAFWLFTDSTSPAAKVMIASTHEYATSEFFLEDGALKAPTAGTLTSSVAIIDPAEAALSTGSGPEDMFDEGNSLDLSPIKLSQGAFGYGSSSEHQSSDSAKSNFGLTVASDGGLDDTFQFHRKVANTEKSAAIG